MRFKLNIQEIRKEKGISQTKLAKDLKINQQMVSKYETGKATPSLLKTIEIAEALDVSLDELVEFKKIHQKTGQEYIDMMSEEDQDE